MDTKTIEQSLQYICQVLENIENDLKVVLNYDSQPRLLSVKELSQKLGISTWKVNQMAEEKTIPYHRAGSRKIFDFNEVKKSIQVNERREKRKMKRM